MQTETIFVSSVDFDKTACHSVLFGLISLFALLDNSRDNDGKVHFIKSGVKGLKQSSVSRIRYSFSVGTSFILQSDICRWGCYENGFQNCNKSPLKEPLQKQTTCFNQCNDI